MSGSLWLPEKILGYKRRIERLPALQNTLLVLRRYAVRRFPRLDRAWRQAQQPGQGTDPAEAFDYGDPAHADAACTILSNIFQRKNRAVKDTGIRQGWPMPSRVSAELKRLRNSTRPKLSVRALAAMLEMPQSTYSFYEDAFKKDELPVSLVRKLAPLFAQRGVDPARVWALAGIKENPSLIASSEPDFDVGSIEPMARIEEFDVRAAAGGGMLLDDDRPPSVVYEWQMPRELIRSVTYSPLARIKIITVVGDSMEDTFRPYEKVMVDTQDRTPSPPGIFVVYDGLGLVVKRVEYVPHSDPPMVRISSDNARYGPYERSLGEAHIQGRVLGRWQWV